MNKLMNLAILSLILLIISNNGNSFAQKNQDKKIVREEIRSYVNKNILPELKMWKNTLDKSISEKDLAQLNLLRNDAKSLRERTQSDIKAIRKQDKSEGQNIEKAKIAEERGKLKSEIKKYAIQLQPYLQKYKDVIRNIGESAKSKKETWKSDILEILKTHGIEKKNIKNNINKFTGLPLNILNNGKANKKHQAIMFMLWDGNEEILNNDRGFILNPK